MKESTTINFSNTKSIITYDLSPCDISASDICKEDSRLHNCISVKNEGDFNLPNTTIRTSLNKINPYICVAITQQKQIIGLIYETNQIPLRRITIFVCLHRKRNCARGKRLLKTTTK